MVKRALLILILLSAGSALAQVSMPWAEQPIFCNNGQPCSLGFVYTYQTGTSTLLSTYTDYTGLFQNSNPILLNAAGFPTCSGLQCGIWLQGGVTYRIVVQNLNHVQQYVIDGLGSVVTVTAPTNFISNPGNFTASTWNTFVTSQYGSESAHTIWGAAGNPGGVGPNTDALEGVITTPVGSTNQNSDAVAGYCANFSASVPLGGGCAGGYFLANAQVAGSKAWGINPIATDIPSGSGGGAATLYGIEDDIGIFNSGTIGGGLLFNGIMNAQSASFPAITINKPSGGGLWTNGIFIQNGATQNGAAINIGALATGNSQASQFYGAFGTDSGGTQHEAAWQATQNGDFQLVPTPGRGVLILSGYLSVPQYTFATLPVTPPLGTMVDCTNCVVTTPSTCSTNTPASCVCTSGTANAIAKYENFQNAGSNWYCQ